MTTQLELFHGPRYWWAAYCRRWQKMIRSSAATFACTISLLLMLAFLSSSARACIVLIYWILSLQICYDVALNHRVYCIWVAFGLLVTVLAWPSLSSGHSYWMIQAAVIGISIYRAYTASTRRQWEIWWRRFSFSEFDPDHNRSLSSEELHVKFNLGSKTKASLKEVEKFLRIMQDLGYVKSSQSIAYPRTSTWQELNIGQGHIVRLFLLRGALPPPRTWVDHYMNKRDPQHKLSARELV